MLKKEEADSPRNFFYLLNIAIILMLIGLLMVYSSSYLFSKENFHDSSYFFVRQVFFFVFGIGIISLVRQFTIQFLLDISGYIHFFVIIMLILTLFPLFGPEIKGAHRWLNCHYFLFQPAELLKYSELFIAIKFALNYPLLNKLQKKMYICALVFPLLVLAFQPDFGVLFIVTFGIFFIGFLSSIRRKYLIIFLLLSLAFLVIMVAIAPYRVQRILTYLDPWKDPQRAGFQIIQSYLAFANGHYFGTGIGNSNAKLFYLPEAHNDFILSVVGEEFGLFGVLLIWSLYLGLIYFGIKIIKSLNKEHEIMVVASFIMIICLQAFLNMGVVLGLLPTKGLNLPFVSYGGSSIVSNCLAIGVVLSTTKNKSPFGMKLESNLRKIFIHIDNVRIKIGNELKKRVNPKYS